MQGAPSAPPRLTDHQKRMLTILDAAIPIEEQLSKKLAECEKAGDANESLRKEITALARRLAAVVEEGRDEEADAALATLSGNVRQSSTFVAVDFGRASLPAFRAGDEPPAASTDTVPVSTSIVESRRSLRNLKDQILTVARQAMETGDATSQSQADVRDAAINQEITVKSAAAEYDSAKLKARGGRDRSCRVRRGHIHTRSGNRGRRAQTGRKRSEQGDGHDPARQRPTGQDQDRIGWLDLRPLGRVLV